MGYTTASTTAATTTSFVAMINLAAVGGGGGEGGGGGGDGPGLGFGTTAASPPLFDMKSFGGNDNSSLWPSIAPSNTMLDQHHHHQHQPGGEETQAGSQEATLIMFILWGTVLPLVAGVGLVGNVLTMVVLWRREMHSTTILYLRALVITDTGILIGSVITLTPISCANYLRGSSLMYFKHWVYPVIYAPGYYVIMTLQQCNVWITVSVSIERYIAICHPFRAGRLITKRKTLIVIFAITAISLLYNLPHLFATRFVDREPTPTTHHNLNNTSNSSSSFSSSSSSSPSYFYNSLSGISLHNLTETVTGSGGLNNNNNYNNKNGSRFLPLPDDNMLDDYWTEEPPEGRQVQNTAFGDSMFYNQFRTVLYAVIIHIIPLLALVVLNSFLIKELMLMKRRRSSITNEDDNEANLSLVLVLIVIVFILCQTPGLISQFGIRPDATFHIWLAVSNLLFTTNSAVNFLIYTAFGRKFRKVLLRVFRRISKRGGSHFSHFSVRGYNYNDYEMSTVGDVGNDTRRPSEVSRLNVDSSNGKDTSINCNGNNGGVVLEGKSVVVPRWNHITQKHSQSICENLLNGKQKKANGV